MKHCQSFIGSRVGSMNDGGARAQLITASTQQLHRMCAAYHSQHATAKSHVSGCYCSYLVGTISFPCIVMTSRTLMTLVTSRTLMTSHTTLTLMAPSP
jgi:hypothetical protein